MAMELQVSIGIVNTEPEQPGNPGILMRSQKSTSLIVDDSVSVVDTWTIANARLSSVVDDCVTDIRGQIELVERANR